MISNAHNPSGALASTDVLEQVGIMAEAIGARVLVDEVYAEAQHADVPPPSPAAKLGPAFVSTNSLTKAYGLAGLRCGWVLASPELSARIRSTRDIVDGNPAAVQKLVDAWYLTLDYMKDNPDEATTIMAGVAETSVEEYEQFAEGTTLFTAEEALAAFQPGDDTTSLQHTAELINPFLVDSGFTETEAPLDGLVVMKSIWKNGSMGDVQEGANTFRVYANIDAGKADAAWLPGMIGEARLEIEKKPLAWVWTHRLIDWLRLKVAWTETGPDGDRLTATSYIQRINTVGGLAPAAQDCDAGTAGQQREIPYSADYVFFKEAGR